MLNLSCFKKWICESPKNDKNNGDAEKEYISPKQTLKFALTKTQPCENAVLTYCGISKVSFIIDIDSKKMEQAYYKELQVPKKSAQLSIVFNNRLAKLVKLTTILWQADLMSAKNNCSSYITVIESDVLWFSIPHQL